MDLPENQPALGTVVEVDRGSLPFHLVHGESLVASAAWALGEAGVVLLDMGQGWEGLVEAGESVVLHDALCPLTPAEFIHECIARSQSDDIVVVGHRPVTDTVKQVTDGTVGQTVDREGLIAVTSPIVLPPRVVADLTGEQLPNDFTAAFEFLRARYDVLLQIAPAQGRRVASTEDIRVLEALTGS